MYDKQITAHDALLYSGYCFTFWRRMESIKALRTDMVVLGIGLLSFSNRF